MSIYKLKLDANLQTSKRANTTNISIYIGMLVVTAAFIMAIV